MDPRAQANKKGYQFHMKQVIEEIPNIEIKQDMAAEIVVQNKEVCGVQTKRCNIYAGKKAILTTGTFLRRLIHIGNCNENVGRIGELSSEDLSASLQNLGFPLGRLKTATPAWVNRESMDFTVLKRQDGDPHPFPFIYATQKIECPQVPCYITHTNNCTHEIIRKNLNQAPLYTGQIKGIGPCYCPSIADKVVRFADSTEQHQIFIEPEGLSTEEMYLNGISSSLPEGVSIESLREGIKGLENTTIPYD